MNQITVRRNSLKIIRAMLSKCELITCLKYDDHDTNTDKGGVSVDAVMAAGDSLGFDRVYKSVDESGELKRIVVSISRHHSYTGYATKADAKELLTSEAFAKYFPIDAEIERQAQEVERRIERAAHQEALAAAAATLVTKTTPEAFYKGQRIIATFASLNKNGDLSEYVMECAKPKVKGSFWDRTRYVETKNWDINTCQVGQVVNMSTSEYDNFSRNLMAPLPEAFEGFTGGTVTDYHPGREIKDVYELTDDERALWIAHSYSVVAVVTAPDRRPFVVNPQGYNYARYAGLSPKSLHTPAGD
ncbi:hypothetical protein RBA41_31335 [Massilia sp. CCM 9210]|uniref:hypothetical protein n=1 Tax=Massilia scottii TaxID=3057166 RepID=UPI0027966856|nr:hypothetical protein [Massilia sp. CCM 9210]MDQ1817804.1 hypothetical protein [Massilia sp. CCM 9210]